MCAKRGGERVANIEKKNGRRANLQTTHPLSRTSERRLSSLFASSATMVFSSTATSEFQNKTTQPAPLGDRDNPIIMTRTFMYSGGYMAGSFTALRGARTPRDILYTRDLIARRKNSALARREFLTRRIALPLLFARLDREFTQARSRESPPSNKSFSLRP